MTETANKLETVQANLRQQMGMWVTLRRHSWTPGMPGVGGGASTMADPRRYCCNEDLVLRHGRAFTRAEPRFATIPKTCFVRAYEIAMRGGEGWIYCEGYALNPRCPVAVGHAWLTRADTPDLAHELAWDWGDSSDTAYYGMAFDMAYVRKVHVSSKRRFYSVLDHWWGRNSYPLLSGDVRIEDVMWKGTNG